MKTVLLISSDVPFCDAMRGAFTAARQARLVIVNRPVTEASEVDGLAESALVIVDLDCGKPDQMMALQPLVARIAGRAPVIVLAGAFDAAVGRWLVQLKISDFLCKPVKPDEVLRAAVALLAARQDTARKEAQITVFIGAAGGVGATTLAIETTMQTIRRAGSGEATCLVDLDLTSDACADYLDLEPRLDLAEIGKRGERLDLQLLEALCARHKSGLAVIASPAHPAETFDVEPEAVGRLLDVVAMRFDNVVIDLPRIWRPWTDAVLGGADKVFVVADMTAPGLRVARRLVERIVERTKGAVEPKIVVNRFTRSASFANGLRASDVERALGSAYAGAVVSNYGLVREAIDRGMSLEELKPGNNVSADLERILHPAAPPDAKLATRVVQFLSRF